MPGDSINILAGQSPPAGSRNRHGLPIAQILEVERALQSGAYGRMTVSELRSLAGKLRACGELSVKYLFQVSLTDPSPERRQLATGILGKIGSPEIIEKTWHILENTALDDRRRLEVLGILLQTDDYDLDLERSAACFSDFASLTSSVIDVLSSLSGCEEHVFLWQCALIEMSAELQHVVVRMLLESRSPSVIPHLRSVIELQDQALANMVAFGLREFVFAEAVGLLGELQSYPAIDVRRVARDSMRVLHSKGVSLQNVFVQASRSYYKLHRVYKLERAGLIALIVSRWTREGNLKYGVFLVDQTKRGLHTCFGDIGLTEEEFADCVRETARRFDAEPEAVEPIELKEARQAIHYGCCVARENGYPIPATYIIYRDLIDRTQE